MDEVDALFDDIFATLDTPREDSPPTRRVHTSLQHISPSGSSISRKNSRTDISSPKISSPKISSANISSPKIPARSKTRNLRQQLSASGSLANDKESEDEDIVYTSSA